MSNKILVTGAAGFIGFHLSNKLMDLGYDVVGVDNVNDYYDVRLKRDRLELLKRRPSQFTLHEISLTDKASIDSLFKGSAIDYVVNLAAQAGVRYSLVNPYAYLESNLHGFLNILEACRHNKIKHLVYASSSSVYGANRKMPFSVHDNVDHPLSLYAASKKSNELMAHTYSSLFNLPTTGLRFFNVYGTYGRPDMALFIFTKAILEGRPIDVYNHGQMKRDFTYIDDVVECISRLIPHIAKPNPDWKGESPDPASSFAPYRIYNVGNSRPIELMDFITAIENKLGRTAVKEMKPILEGDAPENFADVEALVKEIGFRPNTSVATGIGRFIDWYIEYYKVKV